MPSSIQELKIKPSNFKKNPLENNTKGLWKDKNQQNKSSDIQKLGSTCRLKPENQICGNYIVNDIHIANKVGNHHSGLHQTLVHFAPDWQGANTVV